MKWFFALNESSTTFADYSKMVKVAVETARRYTRLEPHLIYDGGENELTDWLRGRGAAVIKRRSFLYQDLQQLALARRKPDIVNIGAGAFLRVEIPQMAAEIGFADEYVLYTDVDVMFMSAIDEELSQLAPRFFAVAPEKKLHDYRRMNSGVMLMNLSNLRETDKAFRQFIIKNLVLMVENSWDQTAYRLFYQTFWRGFKWDKLAPEFNWKPYWGTSERAKIIHFHGPKPFQRELLEASPVSEPARPLLQFATPTYFELCRVWEDLYRETLRS